MSISGTSWNSNSLFTALREQRRNSTEESGASGSTGAAQMALMAMRAVANSGQESGGTSDASRAPFEVTSQGRNSLAALFGAGIGVDSSTNDQSSDTASSFMENLRTMLQAVEAGDTDTAETAAKALQSTLDTLTGSTTESGDTASTNSDSGETGFLSDLKTLLAAIASGDTDATEAAADKLSEGMQRSRGPGGPGGPGGPPPPRLDAADSETAESLKTDLATLFSAVESGDTETAQAAAASVQQTLDSIASASGASTDAEGTDQARRGGFMSDLDDLLSAVKSGDMESAKTTADTIMERMSEGPGARGPMGPPPPPFGDAQGASDLGEGIAALFSAVQSGDEEASDSAATSLQAMLDALTSSTSTDGTTAASDDTASGFIGELQDLLDALKSGDTSHSRLWSVLTAYQENGDATTDVSGDFTSI